MPSKTADPRDDRHLIDLDNDDPFASPSPDSGSKKRKERDGLGIDKELDLKKKARVPRVKLDEERYAHACYTVQILH
jgi:replication fork protection complex subunit Csm3/Swi3